MVFSHETIKRRLSQRDDRESLFRSIIASYLRLLESATLSKYNAAEKDDYVTNRSDREANLEERLLKLQEEIIAVHRRKDECTMQLEKTALELKKKDEEIELLTRRNDELSKIVGNLNNVIEEKSSIIHENAKAIELQADEYRTLQLHFNVIEDKYNKMKRENEILLQRVTARQNDIAEKLNAELTLFNERRKQHATERASINVANPSTSPPHLSFRNSVVNAFENFFQGTESPASKPVAFSPVSTVKKITVPSDFVLRWECSDNENFAAKFHPSGSYIGIAGGNRKIQLWTISENSATPYVNLTGSNAAVTSIDFEPENGNLVAGGSNDFACRIWSLNDRRLRHTFTGHTGKVSAVKFMPSGHVASGSSDRTIRIWDLTNRLCCRTLCVGSVCLDLIPFNDSGCLASSHWDKKVRLWDSKDQASECSIPFNEKVTSLDLSPDKTLLLCCCRDDKLHVVDLRAMKVSMVLSDETFRTQSDHCKSVFSPDGVYAAAGSLNGSIIVWNINDGTNNHLVPNDGKLPVVCTAWHPQGDCFVSVEKRQFATVWR